MLLCEIKEDGVLSRISIIVPVHNTEPYLRECLDSIKAQVVTDIEVICIDDASTDGSSEILAEYAAADSRFKVVSMPEPIGPGAARNIGIDMAQGQYIGFVDSDDHVHPMMYRDLLAAFNSSHLVDFSICGIRKFSDRKDEKFAKGVQENILSTYDGQVIDWETLGDGIFDLRFVCWNRLYRKDLILASNARFSEGIFYEDLIFHFTVFTKARKFVCLKKALYSNRRQRSGATTFEQGDRAVGLVTALKQLDEYFSKLPRFYRIEERYHHFAYKKLYEQFHKCDFDSMPVMFDYMKEVVTPRIQDDNTFLRAADRTHLEAVRSHSFEEFLALDYWKARSEVASLKRKNRAAASKRTKERPKQNTIGAFVGSMTRVTISRRSMFFWKVLRKLGFPVVVVEKKPAAVRGKGVAGKPAKKGIRAAVAPAAIAKGKVANRGKVAADHGYPRNSSENQYDALDFLRMREVDALNNSVIARIQREIQETGRKLRIGFLVNEHSKWSGGSLLEDLENTGVIECGFVCILKHNAHKLSREERREEYELNRELFGTIGKVWVDLYDPETDLVRPVEDCGCDILVLQQPWGMKEVPRRLIGRVLCAYIHYGFVIMGNHGMHYNMATFHSYLWKYFTQTEGHRQMHLEYDPSAYNKIEIVGYPKLDSYLKEPKGRAEVDIWKHPDEVNRKRIIFAPHHSFGNNTLRMATLRWSGAEIQRLVTQTEYDTDWVYKPHPNMKYSIWRSKVMTEAEYKMYVADWRHGVNSTVYDEGDYFDLFRSSDVLITDCGSFLAEYLPTGNPIIWLISDKSVGLNAVGEALSEGYYKARNADELRAIFDMVVRRGEDPLREVRLGKISQVMPNTRPSGTIVADYFQSVFFNEPGHGIN